MANIIITLAAIHYKVKKFCIDQCLCFKLWTASEHFGKFWKGLKRVWTEFEHYCKFWKSQNILKMMNRFWTVSEHYWTFLKVWTGSEHSEKSKQILNRVWTLLKILSIFWAFWILPFLNRKISMRFDKRYHIMLHRIHLAMKVVRTNTFACDRLMEPFDIWKISIQVPHAADVLRLFTTCVLGHLDPGHLLTSII